MAIDKRLQIYDEQGNLVDYDILASDVKFLPDGKDLPTKLAELEDEIEDAGSGDGTVTGVKIGSTTYEPTDGVVDLSSPMGNKVDKNGTDSLMTAAEHTKLGNLPTATELSTQMNAKANDNAVVKTITVNGTTQSPVDGNVNISVEGAAGEDGKSAYQSYLDTTSDNPKKTEPEWVASLKGDKGDQGDTVVLDPQSLPQFTIVNDLVTGGGGSALSAEMGKRLRDNVNAVQANIVKLYGKLAHMAFWDATDAAAAAPEPLDWSVPKVTITFDKTLLDSNSILTDEYDNEITGTTKQVDQGDTFTFKIKPKANYALTAASASVSGTTIPPDSTTGGIYTFTTASVTSDITVVLSSTALANRTVTIDNQVGASIVIKKDGTPLSGTTVTVASGGNLTLTVEAAEDYSINSLDAKVNNVSLNPTESSGVYTISASSISSDITIVITGSTTYSGWLTAPKNDTSTVNGVQFGHTVVTNYGQYSGNIIQDETKKTILCPRCAVDPVQNNLGEPAGNSSKFFYTPSGNTLYLKMKPLSSGCYALNVGYYASDYSFISRDSYKDVGANENWETSFSMPTGAVYVKVLLCRRDTYGGTVQEVQSIFDNWDNTTMKYK